MGLFDDLIPRRSTGGLFDDLIPRSRTADSFKSPELPEEEPAPRFDVPRGLGVPEPVADPVAPTRTSSVSRRDGRTAPVVQEAQASEPGLMGDVGRMVAGGGAKGSGAAIEGFGRFFDATNPRDKFTSKMEIGEDGKPRLRVSESTGPSSMVDGSREAADKLRGVGEGIQSGISRASQDAIEGSSPDGKLFDPSTWTLGDNPSVRGYLMLSADVLGSMAPIIVSSIVGGPGAAMVVGGAQSGGAGADLARGEINAAAEDIGADGFSRLERESAYFRELVASGVDREEALRRTRDAGEKLAALFSMPVGALGGAATGQIVTKGIGVLAGKGAATRIAGTAAISGAEEATQEVAETVFARAGTELGSGVNVDVFEGTFGDALLGFIGGAATGGASGVPRRTPPNDRERINSPRLTEADRASPVPNDIIDDGKKAVEDLLSGKVPDGAVPMDTLYGKTVAPLDEAAPNVITPTQDVVQRPLPTDRLSPTLGAAPSTDALPQRPDAPAAPQAPVAASERAFEDAPEFDGDVATGRTVRIYDDGQVEYLDPQVNQEPAQVNYGDGQVNYEGQPDNLATRPANQEQNAQTQEPVPQDQEPVAVSDVPAEAPRPVTPPREILQKRPLTNALKAVGVKPGSPLAKELEARGVNARTAPGLFKATGHTDWDNLPANEWGDYARIVGDDGNGYMSRDGLIQAVEDEMRGAPVQVGNQIALQEAKDLREYVREFGNDDVEIDLSDIPEATITIPPLNDDISTDAERRWLVEGSVAGTLEQIGLTNTLTPAERAEVTNALIDNGGNVEDLVWGVIRRSADGAEQPTFAAAERNATPRGGSQAIAPAVRKGDSQSAIDGSAEGGSQARNANAQGRDVSAAQAEGQVDADFSNAETGEGRDGRIEGVGRTNAGSATPDAIGSGQVVGPTGGTADAVGIDAGGQATQAANVPQVTPVDPNTQRSAPADLPALDVPSAVPQVETIDGTTFVTGVPKAERSRLGSVAPKAVWNEKRQAWRIPTAQADAAREAVNATPPAQNTPAEGIKAAPATQARLDKPSSYVIRNKDTGEVVMETSDQSKIDALNTDKYEAVPVQQHLAELNDTGSKARKAAEDGGNTSGSPALDAPELSQKMVKGLQRAGGKLGWPDNSSVDELIKARRAGWIRNVGTQQNSTTARYRLTDEGQRVLDAQPTTDQTVNKAEKPAHTPAQKKAIKDINRALTPENAEGGGWYVAGGLDVQMDESGDSDIQFAVEHSRTRYKGRVKQTDYKSNVFLLSEISDGLSASALREVDAYREYMKDVDEQISAEDAKPTTDQTEAGTQTVIPGAEQSTQRSEKARDADRQREADVRRQQSKLRTGVEQDGPGGLFDTDQGDMFKEQRQLDMFYSPLYRALSQAKQKQAPAKDWKAIIAKLPGVKAVEIEWLGINDWLDSQEGTQIPREAVMQFVADSQIQIVEDRQGGRPDDFDARFETLRNDEVADGWSDADIEEQVLADAEMDGEYTPTAFESYTEDGGTNYREILLRVPDLHESGKNTLSAPQRVEVARLTEEIKAIEAKVDDINADGAFWRLSLEDQKRYNDLTRRRSLLSNSIPRKNPFVQSAHFEQENIVVHARVKDRTGPNGERVLFVEEIQSDLASVWRESQESPEIESRRASLREQRASLVGEKDAKIEQMATQAGGYDTLDVSNVIARVQVAYSQGQDPVDNMRGEQADIFYSMVEANQLLMEEILDIDKRIGEIRNQELRLGTEKRIPEGTPDTPFQQEHTYNLMVKRLLRMAAEEGYDQLSWTPGYMQAERWNSAAQSVVEGIEWYSPDQESVADYRYVDLRMSGGDVQSITVEPDGKIEAGPKGAGWEGKQLSQVVGPGVAKSVLSEKSGSVSGQKITFPDSGYAIAYDQQTRKAVDKLVKKHGTSVRVDKSMPDFRSTPELQGRNPDGTGIYVEGEGNPVWSVSITPELREAAMQPMAMFRQPSAQDAATVEAAMPDLQKRLKQMMLGRVKLEAVEGATFQGAFEKNGERLRILIGATQNGMKTLNHEVIHALKSLNLFTDAEWEALVAQAKAEWLDKYDIANRYDDLNAEAQIEEAIAEAFADFVAEQTEPGPIKSAFAKMRRMFRALKEWVTGNPSVQGVFEAVDTGRVGGRQSSGGKDGRALQKQINTATEAFKRWFGDSKVVDDSGKPLVVYHGTGADFDAFDMSRAGERWGADEFGTFFTTSRETASGYASMDGRKTDGANIIPAYVALKNPLTIGDLYWMEGGDPSDSADLSRWFSDMFENGRGIVGAFESYATSKEWGEIVEQEGYDGIFLRDPSGKGEALVVATSPEQIKSVYNRGTFDPDDARIMYQRQPSVAQAKTDADVSDAIGEDVTHAVQIDTPVAQRKESFLKAVMTQPIDQAFRIPFAVVGGLDAQGRWKIGKTGYEKLSSLIVDKQFREGGAFDFMNPAIERVRHGMIDRHRLPQDYVETERKRSINEMLIAEEGREHLEALSKSGVGPEEARALQAMLTGEAPTEGDLAGLAEPIRKAIDELGAEAVQLGLVSAESYQRNRGTYLHRVYAKSELDQAYLNKFINGFTQGRRRKIIGDQFKGRGMFETVAADGLFSESQRYMTAQRGAAKKGDKVVILDLRSTDGTAALDGMEQPKGRLVKRVYWPAEEAIPEALSNYANRGEWEVRGESGKNVVLWRDFTKDERLKMGEILDARYTIAKTWALMAHDLATGRFFKSVAENEDWSRKQPPKDAVIDYDPQDKATMKRLWMDPSIEWVQVPTTKIPKSDASKYGALAGRYVRADIWRDLEEIRIMQTPGFYRQMMTQFKINKTARSVVTHMNNVMSNFMLMDMADVRMPELVSAISEMAKDGKMYKEAKTAGAFGADMVTQEFRKNVLQPLLQEIADDLRGGQGGVEGSIGRLGRFMDRLHKGIRKLDDKMVSAYQMEDEVFRMATYIRRRQQGLSVEDAAIEARDQFLNYDIRAPWVNAARQTLLPFISYTYRAIPKVAQTMVERPWKVAKYIAITQALNALAYAVAPSDYDEEEERASMRANESGKTWIYTDRMMRAPYLSDAGDPVFLDVRRWVPAGDVFDMQGDIPSWLQVGGPIVIGMELYLNKAAFTQKEITNPHTDTGPERMAKRADFLYKSWMPSAPWIPNSWYQEKIARAAKGGAREWYTNEPYSLLEAVASSAGIKLKPKNIEAGRAGWEIEFNRIERELAFAEKTLKNQAKRKLIDREELVDGMSDIAEKKRRLAEARNTQFEPFRN